MAYLIVAAVSLLVGGVVFLVTVRASVSASSAVGFGDEEGFGSADPDPNDPGDAPPGYAYLQVSTQGPAVQDRIVGALVLVLLVGVSAAVLALAIYQAGHLINQTIQAFLE